MAVQNQPGKIFLENLSRKNPSQKRVGRGAQGIDPEFKSQHCKKKSHYKD
jgi:hypothetical protein